MEYEAGTLNLFMVCHKLKRQALSSLPSGYSFRLCQAADLPFWKAMHYDDPAAVAENLPYMDRYFEQVYAGQGEHFFQRCLLVCEDEGAIVGSCFAWPAYGQVSTIHWFKVIKAYEGLGIGRALLSAVMLSLGPQDYPVCLHTQPESSRAIKLYSDFGFCLITDDYVGRRRNNLQAGLALLRGQMPAQSFEGLCFAKVPLALHEAALAADYNAF